MPSPPESPYTETDLTYIEKLLPKHSPRHYFDDLNTPLTCARPEDWPENPNFHNVCEGYWVFLPCDFSILVRLADDNDDSVAIEEVDTAGADDAQTVEDVESSLAGLNIAGDHDEVENGPQTTTATQVSANGSITTSSTPTSTTTTAATNPEHSTNALIVSSSPPPPTLQPFTAVGTTGLIFCIGLYLEVPSSSSTTTTTTTSTSTSTSNTTTASTPHYLLWHIFGAPAGFKTLQPSYDAIKRTYTRQLHRMLGPCPSSEDDADASITSTTNNKTLDSLIICHWYLAFGGHAIVDGILVWAGVEDTTEALEEGRRKYCRRATGFVVKEPGKGSQEGNVVVLLQEDRLEKDGLVVAAAADGQGEWRGVDVWMGRRHGCLQVDVCDSGSGSGSEG